MPGGNTASGDGAAISGGGYNAASGTAASIAGGANNSATNYFSAVGGGFMNESRGLTSFAAGLQAKANEAGSFVWGDSFPANKLSTGIDTFNVYASGGSTFFTNTAATTGVTIANGAGSWSSLSDRASKENVEAVDGRDVLARLAAMPIATWNYKSQADAVRHMGPMAQDFHAAFGLGISNKLIDTIDPDGVALAAIQGLNTLLLERETEIAELRSEKDAEISALRAELDAIKALLEALLER